MLDARRLDARIPDKAMVERLWTQFVEGTLSFQAAGTHENQSYVIAKAHTGPPASRCKLTADEMATLERTLCGEPQKVVAAALRVARSTASRWHATALAKLLLAHRPFPLPLVLAAQASTLGRPIPAEARHASLGCEGATLSVLSVPRPRITDPTRLTIAERDVAALLVEGLSRDQIARRRGTSIQTVFCQTRSIISKYSLRGRFALIRLGLDLGWFGPGAGTEQGAAVVRTWT